MMVQHALGGEWLHTWWNNWKEARNHVVQGSGGYYDRHVTIERREDGIHLWVGKRYEGPSPELTDYEFETKIREPDCIMRWTEVRDLILAGSTPRQRKQYEECVRKYCWETDLEALKEARRIGDEIIAKGCELIAKRVERQREFTQDTLF